MLILYTFVRPRLRNKNIISTVVVSMCTHFVVTVVVFVTPSHFLDHQRSKSCDDTKNREISLSRTHTHLFRKA